MVSLNKDPHYYLIRAEDRFDKNILEWLTAKFDFVNSNEKDNTITYTFKQTYISFYGAIEAESNTIKSWYLPTIQNIWDSLNKKEPLPVDLHISYNENYGQLKIDFKYSANTYYQLTAENDVSSILEEYK